MAVSARVGIVSWNTAGLLARCLAALPAALAGLDASVVVVDNASADGSAEAADAAGVEVKRNDRNMGYARGMNQALGGADTQVLIALNPDTEPPPGSLAALAGRLVGAPDVGLVSPRLVNFDGSLQHSAYTFPSPRQAAAVAFLPARVRTGRIGRRLWLEGAAPHDEPSDVEWTIGAVHVMRSEAVDRAHPYSERWFMYVEDMDLCWRLARAGWRRRLEADISIPHVGGASAVQAGPDTARRRWTPLSYDWYAETHGTAAMRRWAAVNALGAGWLAASSAAHSFTGRGNRARRSDTVEWARMAAVHARVVIRRPPLPEVM